MIDETEDDLSTFPFVVKIEDIHGDWVEVSAFTDEGEALQSATLLQTAEYCALVVDRGKDEVIHTLYAHEHVEEAAAQ